MLRGAVGADCHVDAHRAAAGSSCALTGLRYGPCGRCALRAPEGVAEADQGDAGGNGEQPFVLRHDADCDGCQRSNSQECRSPAGEDVGAEQCDAEDEAASQVSDPGDVDHGLHQADVTNRGAIVDRGDDVADVGGRTVSEGGQDKGSDECGAQYQEEAGGEQDVPEQAE